MTKRFSASSAAQLMQCHGSANLELAIPGFKEPKRDEMAGAKGVGTRMHTAFQPLAHWSPMRLADLNAIFERYAEKGWRERRKMLADLNDPDVQTLWLDEFPRSPWVEILPYVKWIYDLDHEERLPPLMLRYVKTTLEKLSELKDSVRSNAQTYTEESIDCTWLPSSPSTTPDIVIISANILDVVDYKTGRIPVSPVDNFQLMFYAYSAMVKYYDQMKFWIVRPQRIRMHIWQPGNHDSWECDVQHLEQWAQLAHAADVAIKDGDLTLRPGSACTFCPANPHSRGDKAPPYCPAMMALLYPDTTDEEGILELD
jgi:Protein of unknown function (DUF2800)